MGRAVIAIVFVGAMLFAMPAPAEIGTFDITPAATLLLPYFEVDPSSEDGINTTLQVRNADAAAILAHVMFFTDYSVGTFAFDLYLTGFDVETIDLGAIFRGTAELDYYPLELPRDTPVDDSPPPPTSEIFADGFETGDLSRWSAVESRITVSDWIAYHTGEPASRTGLCAGVSHGDGLVRGYVLINATSLETGDRFPEDVTGYFGGVTSDDNVLLGEYRITDPDNNAEIGNPLVSIEGSALSTSRAMPVRLRRSISR